MNLRTGAHLQFALKEGRLVHIDQVENGIASGAICPSCEGPLIAKNGGEQRIHHFAHTYVKTCQYGYQTSLHLLAKEIIKSAGEIHLPSFKKVLPINNPTIVDFLNGKSKEEYEVFSERKIKIDRVDLEKKHHSYIPDVIVFSGNRKIIIEIAVTHFVGRNKLDKIIDSDTPAIEIDLSHHEKEVDHQTLQDFLLNSYVGKRWLYNPRGERKADELHDRMMNEWKNKYNIFVEKENSLKKHYRRSVKISHTNQYTLLGCPLYIGGDNIPTCKGCKHFGGYRENFKYGICQAPQSTEISGK
jgi:hypothetical protein